MTSPAGHLSDADAGQGRKPALRSRSRIAGVVLVAADLLVDLVVHTTLDIVEAVLDVVEAVRETVAQLFTGARSQEQRSACTDSSADRDQAQRGQCAAERARTALEANHAQDVVPLDATDCLGRLLSANERSQSPQSFVEIHL